MGGYVRWGAMMKRCRGHGGRQGAWRAKEGPAGGSLEGKGSLLTFKTWEIILFLNPEVWAYLSKTQIWWYWGRVPQGKCQRDLSGGEQQVKESCSQTSSDSSDATGAGGLPTPLRLLSALQGREHWPLQAEETRFREVPFQDLPGQRQISNATL